MKPFFTSRFLALVAVFAFLIVSFGCGSDSTTANPTSVTGTWTVTLFDSNSASAYSFKTTLAQEVASPASTSPVTGSNLTVNSTNKSCFDAGSSPTQTGTYTVNGNFNGLTTNTLQLTITGNPGVVTMFGSFTGNEISGPWTLQTTGTGCVLNGTFLMTRS